MVREQTEQGYLGGGGPGLGWMSPERRMDEMKGLEKGCLSRGALGVGADISPLRQHLGKITNGWMSVCWSNLAPLYYWVLGSLI